MLSKITNWLFPVSCNICGEKGAYICKLCLFSCEPAKIQEEYWVASLFSYKDKFIKKSIWEIKYHGHFDVAEAFGERLAETAFLLLQKYFKEAGKLNENKIIIIPIPPSKVGGKKRGYNQAEIIARALFKNASFPAVLENYALEKIKQTEKQATIHEKSRRLQNMKNAFAVSKKFISKFIEGINNKNQHRLSEHTIILVDDVVTTGATLCDARRALLEAGAREVLAVTIAH